MNDVDLDLAYVRKVTAMQDHASKNFIAEENPGGCSV